MSFTAFPLDKLGLSPAHLQLCTKANFINAQDILLPPLPDLSRRLKIRLPEAQALVRAVSSAIAPRTSVVSSLIGNDAEGGGSGLGKRKRRIGGGCSDGEGWIRTGDAALDHMLGGGIRIGCVTEIVGESAAGKSHLTLHLAIAAQLPSLTSRPGGAMILTSERELATTRLKQLAEDMRGRHAQNVFLKRDSLFDGVLTKRVENVEELEAVLSYGVPAILEQGRGAAGKSREGSRLMGFEDQAAADEEERVESDGMGGRRRNSTPATPGPKTPSTPSLLTPLPRAHRRPRTSTSAIPAPAAHRAPPVRPGPIRLIILDSLTALLRGAETSFTSNSAGFTARSRHLCSIGDKLKALAVEYELAIVVINQVSDVFDRKSFSKPAFSTDEDKHPNPTPTPHPTSSGSFNLTHDQAWYAAGPDPPMLYATQSRWFSGQGLSGKKEATLGIVWANMVNTRIMLSRTGRRRVVRDDEVGDVLGRNALPGGMGDPDHGEIGEEGERMLIRRAHLVFSPFAPPGTIDFVIAANGVRALPKTYILDESGASVLARARKLGGEDEEEMDNGEVEAEDDLFGPLDGLDDVPDEWWAGIVDGEVPAEAVVENQ